MRKTWKHLQYLKLWIIIVMVIVFSVYPTFAANECSWTASDSLDKLYVFLWNLWRLCSWVWIILSNFAGVLMTNTLVYWEFIWLDSFLWKIWQMSRSIANYALWFFFIYYIFRYIFSPWEKNPLNKIKDLLVASVLVQASWFLVMVLVDLSTILLATVSSFPAQIMNTSAFTSNAVNTEIKKNPVLKNNKSVIKVNAFSDSYLKEANTKWYTVEEASSEAPSEADTITIDSLLPSASNLWGPFVYLWFTALNAQDYMFREMPTAASCKDKIEKVIINMIVESWVLIFYSLSLMLLIIMLIMRLWYLWVIIALSPIIVLLSYTDVIKKDSFDDIFDLKKSLMIIFQPVIYWLWIGLMFLFIVTIQWVFSSNMSSDLWGGVIVNDKPNSSSSTDVVPKISSDLQNANIVGFYVREGTKSLKDIILSLIVLVLMWQFVKLAILWKAWGMKWHSAFAEFWRKWTRNISTAFETAPVIPIPWSEHKLWLWTVFDWTITSEALKNLNTTLRGRDKSQQTINDLFWFGTATYITPMTSTQQSELQTRVPSDKKADLFVQKLQEIWRTNDWLRYNETIEKIVLDWIKNHKTWQYALKNTNEYNLMLSYFGSILWEKILAAKDEEILPLIKNANYKEGFQTFYQNVLWWSNPDTNFTYEIFMTKHNGEISYGKPENS